MLKKILTYTNIILEWSNQSVIKKMAFYGCFGLALGVFVIIVFHKKPVNQMMSNEQSSQKTVMYSNFVCNKDFCEPKALAGQ